MAVRLERYTDLEAGFNDTYAVSKRTARNFRLFLTDRLYSKGKLQPEETTEFPPRAGLYLIREYEHRCGVKLAFYLIPGANTKRIHVYYNSYVYWGKVVLEYEEGID